MTWGWRGRGPRSITDGGTVGSPAEARVAHAWPEYENIYLKNKLSTLPDSDGIPPNFPGRDVYLERATENWKEEADECLYTEFKDWLQGKHTANHIAEPYVNGGNKPVRRYMFRNDLPIDREIGDPMKPAVWNPTWWGRDQLTHLPGVRELLRNDEETAKSNEVAMNLLAEHGPQDLEQAWMYFKHWVKQRPLSDATCMPKSVAMVTRPPAGEMGHHLNRSNALIRNPPDTPPAGPAATAAGVAAAAATAAATGTGAGGLAAMGVAAGTAVNEAMVWEHFASKRRQEGEQVEAVRRHKATQEATVDEVAALQAALEQQRQHKEAAEAENARVEQAAAEAAAAQQQQTQADHQRWQEQEAARKAAEEKQQADYAELRKGFETWNTPEELAAKRQEVLEESRRQYEAQFNEAILRGNNASLEGKAAMEDVTRRTAAADRQQKVREGDGVVGMAAVWAAQAAQRANADVSSQRGKVEQMYLDADQLAGKLTKSIGGRELVVAGSGKARGRGVSYADYMAMIRGGKSILSPTRREVLSDEGADRVARAMQRRERASARLNRPLMSDDDDL